MKRFFILSAVIFGLVSIISAQSGRKIPEQTETVQQKEDQYSESKPTKLPTVYISPKMRREIENRKLESQKRVYEDKSSKTPQTVADEEETITVETNLVTIPVSVFDRNGLYIPNLQQSDFKIFENGEAQEIAYFGTTDKPFTVVLLLDTSLSTEYKIEEIQNSAIAFTNQLKPQDKVIVIEFDGNVNVLSEITNDRTKLHKAIRKADFGFGTSLYDSVDYTFRRVLNKIEGRKAIVLFTDGVDTTSDKSTYDDTVYQAQETDVMIFPIYYYTLPNQRPTYGNIIIRENTPEEYAVGKKYLDDLALSTGGRVFRPDSTEGGLTSTFESIAEELRRQYNIGYYPQEAGKIGERKQIRVRVDRPNLVIRARDSYVVGGESGTKK